MNRVNREIGKNGLLKKKVGKKTAKKNALAEREHIKRMSGPVKKFTKEEIEALVQIDSCFEDVSK